MDREGEAVSAELGDDWRFKAENPELRHKICELQLGEDEKFRLRWVSVRPIPEDNFWFENVWRDYRKGKVFE
jgi:hypothetical protein